MEIQQASVELTRREAVALFCLQAELAHRLLQGFCTCESKGCYHKSDCGIAKERPNVEKVLRPLGELVDQLHDKFRFTLDEMLDC